MQDLNPKSNFIPKDPKFIIAVLVMCGLMALFEQYALWILIGFGVLWYMNTSAKRHYENNPDDD